MTNLVPMDKGEGSQYAHFAIRRALHIRGDVCDEQSAAVFGERRAGLSSPDHPRRKLVFYADTACAVIAHLRKHDPAAMGALGALGLGQLHEHAHTCQQENSMIYRVLAGLGHGEEAETVWAKLKGVWQSLSKQNSGPWHDTLSSIMIGENASCNRALPVLLEKHVSRLKACIEENSKDLRVLGVEIEDAVGSTVGFTQALQWAGIGSRKGGDVSGGRIDIETAACESLSRVTSLEKKLAAERGLLGTGGGGGGVAAIQAQLELEERRFRRLRAGLPANWAPSPAALDEARKVKLRRLESGIEAAHGGMYVPHSECIEKSIEFDPISRAPDFAPDFPISIEDTKNNSHIHSNPL